MKSLVLAVCLLLGSASVLPAQTVCEDGPTPGSWQCYSIDGAAPWLTTEGPTKDFGQVFMGTEGDYQTYLALVSPEEPQSAWVLVWGEGPDETTVHVVYRARLNQGQRKSVLLNRIPMLDNVRAASVRVQFESDGIAGIAMHSGPAFWLRILMAMP